MRAKLNCSPGMNGTEKDFLVKRSRPIYQSLLLVVVGIYVPEQASRRPLYLHEMGAEQGGDSQRFSPFLRATNSVKLSDWDKLIEEAHAMERTTRRLVHPHTA